MERTPFHDFVPMVDVSIVVAANLLFIFEVLLLKSDEMSPNRSGLVVYPEFPTNSTHTYFFLLVLNMNCCAVAQFSAVSKRDKHR